jgi:hypothetical protein
MLNFTASSERFQQFRNHYSFHNVKMSGESASTEGRAIEEVLQTLDKLIMEENCFLMDKTCLHNDKNHLMTPFSVTPVSLRTHDCI